MYTLRLIQVKNIVFSYIFKMFIKIFYKNIRIKEGVRFLKFPQIITNKNTLISIGKNVVINSENIGYHVNMYNKCKLIVDRVGGEITIGDNTRIHGSCIHAFNKISIGKNCLIAANCQIIDGNGHDLCMDNPSNRINTSGGAVPVFIKDDVWLATGVVVLPGVTIGKGSVITANSVVHKNIPPNVIAGGNPIRIIKDFN